MRPLTASTVVTTPAARKWWRSTGSARRVESTGRGSASPVLSITRRRNIRTVPRSRRECRSRMVAARSPRTVQQRQPEPSSTVTGVNAGAASTIGIQSGQQLRIKRIAAAARQSLGRGPEMAKVADDLALAGESRKQERRALPIGEPQAVELQHAISDLHAASALLPAPRRIVVAREDALARDR